MDHSVMGWLVIALGISGWALPYRFNLLRPKRLLEGLIPEGARPMVPKVLGTLLILGGLVVVFTQPKH